MQYLLSQKEYDALVPKVDLDRMAERRDFIVQALMKDCIHEPDSTRSYCDDCPICSLGHEIKGSICGRGQSYSK